MSEQKKDSYWQPSEIPRIFVLSDKAKEELAEYYSLNHERIRREHKEIYDKLLKEQGLQELIDKVECECPVVAPVEKQSLLKRIYFILRSLVYGK